MRSQAACVINAIYVDLSYGTIESALDANQDAAGSIPVEARSMATRVRPVGTDRSIVGHPLSDPHAAERPRHARIEMGAVSIPGTSAAKAVSPQRCRGVLRDGARAAAAREMAGPFAGARLMTHGRRPSALARFAIRILPPHRKDWAEAMFNELAYIESRRLASFWVLGCAWLAIRERISFELERTFMGRRILKAVLGLGAASVIAVVGIYMVQKPYQRERISIYLHRVFGSGQAQAGK